MELLAQAAWPALFAALVAIGVTVAIERWGGVLGGLLATLPTTIVPVSVGIYQSATPDVFASAMAVAPVGMLVDVLFLWTWRAVPPRLPSWALGARLATMLLISLGTWAVVAAITIGALGRLDHAGIAPILPGIAALVVMGGWGLHAASRDVPAPRGKQRVGPLTLIARGVLAGAAIGVAVMLAASGHAMLSGVASVFPAIFLTTMVSLWLAQGESVPAGAVGPMMLGATSVAAFALIAIFALPALGWVLGAAVAWGVSVMSTTLPATIWLRRHRAARGLD